MSRYWFGIHAFQVDVQLEERIREAEEAEAIQDLVAELVQESGPHVLPHLSGDETHLMTVRERHLNWLKLVFSTHDLTASLQAELENYIRAKRPRQPEEAVAVDGDSEIVGECWWWYCDDFDDPDYCYWEEWCDPFTGEQYDEERCHWFGSDGVIHDVECPDDFLCC